METLLFSFNSLEGVVLAAVLYSVFLAVDVGWGGDMMDHNHCPLCYRSTRKTSMTAGSTDALTYEETGP